MKRFRVSSLIVLVLVFTVNLTAFQQAPLQHVKGANLNIVTSLSIVADFAAQIGKGAFTVQSIVTGTENPHIYEPTPSEIELVANADLFIRFGIAGLEPWVDAVLLANPNVKVLTLVTQSMLRYDPLIEALNPHVWMDPTIVKTMVAKIYEEIITLDPANSATYLSNKEAYLAKLDALLAQINATRLTLQNLKVVVHHPSMMYLLDLLGVERVAIIEEHEGEEPSPEHIADIVDKIITKNVSLIINQPQLDEKQVAEIARDTNIKIAELTPLLDVPDVEGFVLAQGSIITSYIKMIEYDLIALKNPHEPPKIGDVVSFWFLIALNGSGFLAISILVIVVRYRHKEDLPHV